jgi:hypothetical protein
VNVSITVTCRCDDLPFLALPPVRMSDSRRVEATGDLADSAEARKSIGDSHLLTNRCAFVYPSHLDERDPLFTFVSRIRGGL